MITLHLHDPRQLDFVQKIFDWCPNSLHGTIFWFCSTSVSSVLMCKLFAYLFTLW